MGAITERNFEEGSRPWCSVGVTKLDIVYCQLVQYIEGADLKV